MIRICICGGGSLGHVNAGFLSCRPDVYVNILTKHPDQWSHDILVNDLNGNHYQGRIDVITSNAEEAVKDCNIVFLCLPGFAIESTLQEIKPYLNGAVVGSVVSSTGFFFAAHKILGKDARLFGFQRVPFIARTVEYGHSANLLGYKPNLAVAVENVEQPEKFKGTISYLWDVPVKLLSSFYEAALTNSNPILHTGRLFSMWKNWNGEKYDHNILFYKEWTDDASQTIIDMDNEFQELLKCLPVSNGAIPTLLDYYESFDAHSLTNKISSISAFQTITSPMKETDGGWIPDFQSRYFTEDFPFGLRFIVELSQTTEISTPCLARVYEWGISRLGANER